MYQQNNKTNCTLVGVSEEGMGVYYIFKQSYKDGHPNSRHMRKEDEWMRRGQGDRAGRGEKKQGEKKAEKAKNGKMFICNWIKKDESRG